jgi:hypothetical protein
MACVVRYGLAVPRVCIWPCGATGDPLAASWWSRLVGSRARGWSRVSDSADQERRWASAPATVEECRARLVEAGLSRYAEALAGLARDSVRLVPDLAVSVIEFGSSRLVESPICLREWHGRRSMIGR